MPCGSPPGLLAWCPVLNLQRTPSIISRRQPAAWPASLRAWQAAAPPRRPEPLRAPNRRPERLERPAPLRCPRHVTRSSVIPALPSPCPAWPCPHWTTRVSQSVRHATPPSQPSRRRRRHRLPWAGMDEVVLGAASLPRAGKPRFTHPGPSFPASHPTVPSGRYWHRVRFALLLLWHCFGMAPPSLAPAVPPSVVTSVYINSSRPPSVSFVARYRLSLFTNSQPSASYQLLSSADIRLT